MRKIDETGNYYGNWEVIREATTEETNGRKGGIYWLCRCKCKDRTEKLYAELLCVMEKAHHADVIVLNAYQSQVENSVLKKEFLRRKKITKDTK